MANKCAITSNTNNVDWLDVFDNFMNDDHHMRALNQTQQENAAGNSGTSTSGVNVDRSTFYDSSSASSSTCRDTLRNRYTSTTTTSTENPTAATGSGIVTAQSPPTIPNISASVIPPVPDPTKNLHKIPSVSATSPPSTKSTPPNPINNTVSLPTCDTVPVPTSNTDLSLINTASLINSTTSETSYLEEDEISAEAKALARSERKRSREKKRRCDVNAQFADLTTLLRKIEDEEGGIQPSSCNNITNRVDLIARTIRTMDKLHNENGKRRLEVEELKENLSKAKKNVEELEEKVKNLKTETKPVMMMVPMMYPNSSNTPGFPVMQPPSSSNPAFPMPPGQFMPQMPYGQMQSLPMYPGGVPQCFPPPMFNPSGVPLPGHVMKPESDLQKVTPLDNFSIPPQPQIATPPPNLAHCA